MHDYNLAWNFAWWYYLLSFICSDHFEWPWPYFKVTAVSNSFNWKFCILIWLSSNFVGLLSQVDTDYTTIFIFLYSREIIDMFSDFTKPPLMLAFWQTPFEGGLSNFAQGLAIHIRFDDLDRNSRKKVCKNHTLQMVFRFLSTVV